MSKNYTMFHCHTDNSNGTLMDATATHIEYIEKAKELGMAAIAFSEHGNVFNWIKKKMDCDKHKIKYIHGMETYMTTTLDEKLKEYYHLGLYAKNYEGVKEINRLSSISYNKEDNHYYYRPRLSLDEIMNTSDNIIITTACLGSILNKRNDECTDRFWEFLTKNKHRCFLEIQYHEDQEQIKYNQFLYEKSLETGIPLIAGTDTHALNKKRARLREVLQKSKNMKFSNEDTYDLTFKSYDELVEMFKKQNSLPLDVVLEAIENTNKMAHMVEEFELDMSHKYPSIYKNDEEELKERIRKGVIQRGVHKFPPEKKKLYFDRILEEFGVMKEMKNTSYFLLLDDIIKFCKSNNIGTSPRGSCNGSLILWVLGITDIDSIKYKLPFFRFLNPARVNLPDVDIDMSGKRRDEVKDFLYTYPNIQGSAIVTFQTYQWKGAVRAVGRGLEIPLSVVDDIVNDIEEIIEENDKGETKTVTTFHNKEKWESEYPELIELVTEAIGLIENVSVHACGFVVTDRNISDEIGTFRTDKSKWVISQNNMKAIDAVNFVKMDLLVVDNVQMVEDVCEMAGIEKLDNDKIDFEDDAVWDEMLKSGLGIFQFEKSGWNHLKESLEHFGQFKKNSNGKISRLDMMTALNGIIRPAGNSIRSDFVRGIPHDSGMVEINEFLGHTLGYLIYQEQIMNWLNKFCNYSMEQSDIVRRAIAKKGGTEKLMPEIKESFIKHCSKNFNYDIEHLNKVVDNNLKVIKDASDYGFSENHSCPYSILGFKGAYLRHYYPLEFLAVQLMINEGKQEKTTKITEFINEFTDIKVEPPKFRYARADYSVNKNKNTIVKGLKSIKFLNEQVAEELYGLRDNEYETFSDLLVDIEENTSINSRQMNILIKINFFEEFGGNNELLLLYDNFHNRKEAYKKTLKKAETKLKRLNDTKEEEAQIRATNKVKVLPPSEQIMFEYEMLGYGQTTYPHLTTYYGVILNADTKHTPRLTLYNLKSGVTNTIKMNKASFNRSGLTQGDIIKDLKVDKKPRNVKIDGRWVPSPSGETELWLISCSKLK